MKKILLALAFLALMYPHICLANNTIAMKIIPEGDISAGKPIKIKLQLSEISSGKAVSENDLKIAHTKKLHLLVIDPTLTDFQHIHPSATEKAGEFVFDFTPKYNGTYRFFADITPVKTGTQEYVIADIGTPSASKPEIDNSLNMQASASGYKFKLLFDSELMAGKATTGTLKIEDENGEPVTKLEPVLGAFAHIVGFSEDYKTPIHIHPLGKEPERDSDRGGAELTFHIEPETSGFIKLFVQVKIDGKDIFVPFGLNVSDKALVMNQYNLTSPRRRGSIVPQTLF